MTKTIQEIQKENRKFILEAIHNCNYAEALKKEECSTCHYLYQTDRGVIRIIGDIKNYGYNRERHHPDAFLIEIIGQPITLGRLLLAFKNKEVKIYNNSLVFSYAWERFYPLIEDKESGAYPEYKLWNLFGFDWDLTSETLEQQSEETQREINKIFTGE